MYVHIYVCTYVCRYIYVYIWLLTWYPCNVTGVTVFELSDEVLRMFSQLAPLARLRERQHQVGSQSVSRLTITRTGAPHHKPSPVQGYLATPVKGYLFINHYPYRGTSPFWDEGLGFRKVTVLELSDEVQRVLAELAPLARPREREHQVGARPQIPWVYFQRPAGYG